MAISADVRSLAAAALARYDVELPPQFDDEVRRLLAPSTPDALAPGASARTLVAAWRATQHRKPPLDVWLACLLLFRERFAEEPDGIQTELAVHSMRLRRTVAEIELRLAGQLFQLGRARLVRGARSSGQKLLEDALALFEQLDLERAPQRVRRAARGMAGTAATLLARDDASAERAEVGAQLLAEAEALGDRTPQHFAYLLEALLRLHDATHADDPLDRAADVWARCAASRTRQLLTRGAELHEALARRVVRRGDHSAAVPFLRRAEQLVTEALALSSDSAVPDGFLRAVRARIRQQLAVGDFEAGGTTRTRWLEGARADLAVPEAREHASPTTQAKTLLARAIQQQARFEHAAALATLEQVSEGRDLDDVLLDEVRAARVHSRLVVSVWESDRAKARLLIEEALALPNGAATPAGALWLATNMLRSQEASRADATELARRAVARLEQDLDRQSLPQLAARHVAGHAARMAWVLARDEQTGESLARALHLFRVGLEDATAPNADLLADAGACALRFANVQLATDARDETEILGLYRDAARWLAAAAARVAAQRDAGDLDVPRLYSRLGEANLRLHALTGLDHFLNDGIVALEQARERGHEWSELAGRLGDALYRRGRREQSVGDLEQALALKEEEFAAGNVSRENRSVAAAAALALYDVTGDTATLERAAILAAAAAATDPLWPWPLLQLAAIVGRARATLDVNAPAPLADAIRERDSEWLTQTAAELAARNPEFAPEQLGGQTKRGRSVYVLADPHRLLERTLVLKRLPPETARREAETTRAFAEYLARTESSQRWRLPEPLGTFADVANDDMLIYVMRRLRGVALGEHLLDASERGEVVALYEEAVRFLAAFNAWARAATDLDGTLPVRRQKKLADALFASARRLGVGGSDLDKLTSKYRHLLAGEMPAVAKKDAHAANWLVADDALVMIDLEATTAVPVLYEVVQLVEDYPLLPADDHGWAERLRLADLYLAELTARGVAIDLGHHDAATLYAWYVIAQAPSALNRLADHPGDNRVSTSGRAARRLRRQHGSELIAYLSANGPRAARGAATAISTTAS